MSTLLLLHRLGKTRRAHEGNMSHEHEGNMSHDAAHVSGGPTLESKAQSGKTHPPAREVA